jgi:hypothetical protein
MLLDCAPITGNRRGLGAVLPKTQISAARTAGWFLIISGAHVEM